MSFKTILKFVNLISLTLGVFYSLELIVALIYGENILKLAIFLAVFIFSNGLCLWYLREQKLKLSIKESILSVNILWIILGISGAIPLFLYTNVSFASAFFEAISGFTTTGATVYTNIEAALDWWYGSYCIRCWITLYY